MVQLVAWGNNAAGNLAVKDGGVIIHEPSVVLAEVALEAIVWASWTCAIARKSDGTHRAWGRTGLKDEQAALTMLDKENYAKIIGHEQPIAVLTRDGRVKPFVATQPSRSGIQDVAVMGLGPVYVLNDCRITRYRSFPDFLDNKDGTAVTHNAFDFKHPISLYATESRVLLLSRGPLAHVFEINENQKREVSVVLLEDLEGLGITTVIPGSANRFVVLTEAGDAYLISKGTIEPELLEIEDESPVRLVDLGSKFEVLVTEQNVWVRGDNQFSQLGLGKGTPASDEVFIKHPYFVHPDQVISLHCGRWSTLALMRDA